MDTYRVDSKTLQTGRRRMPVRVLKIAGAYAVVLLAIKYLWPGESVRERPVWMTVLVIVQAIIFAILLAIFERVMFENYQITISEEEMSAKRAIIRHRVRRGRVRTLLERRNGLMISERGRIGTFLFGGIWVPRQLREYESIKSLACLWKT